MLKPIPFSFLLSATLVVASSATASTVIFSQDFTTGDTSALHGTTTTAGNYTWSADSIFKTNGVASASSASTDRGAALDLGATFFADQYALGNTSLVLSVTLSASTNSVTFAGFTTDSWISAASSAIASEFNAGARAQTQGLTYASRFDSISGAGRDPYSIYNDTGAADAANELRIGTGDSLPLVLPRTLTMTINAGATGYNDATLTVTGGTNGVAYSGVNLSAYRTFFLGFEANGTSSHDIDSINFTAVPEPSTYGLLGAWALAAVALVRRRRKSAGKVAA